MPPHHVPPASRSIESAVGATPLVELTRVPKSEGVEARVWAKCEFLNAGGSVKDRIGVRMVVDAEKAGRIKPGDTLIEPTSGNTGIGLALAGALRGYKVIITLPEKMSSEKVNTLRALGAKVIRTPTEAPFDSPESNIGLAKRLQKEMPNAHILDQYVNPSNPEAHQDGTAAEIPAQLEAGLGTPNVRVDVLVATAGTGGTITGMSRRLKAEYPGCVVVGVDPQGSILAVPDTLNDPDRGKSYKVEGIGYDFIPDVLHRHVVDSWVKTRDAESFHMARRLIREEGMMVGGSSGSAMAGVIKFLKSPAGARFNRPDVNVVVVFADSIRNYMSKFLRDRWMVDHGFLDPTKMSKDEVRDVFAEGWRTDVPVLPGMGESFYGDFDVSALSEKDFSAQVVTAPETLPVSAALDLLAGDSRRVLVVRAKGGAVVGVTTESHVRHALLVRAVKPDEPLASMPFPKHVLFSGTTKLWSLAKSFEIIPLAYDPDTKRALVPLDLMRWGSRRRAKM